MIQDKQAEEEETNKRGRQAGLNKPERGQLVALAVVASPQVSELRTME
jgi:hypothetical protein